MVQIRERIILKCTDAAIRLYIIYLSSNHNFDIQVLDDDHILLLDPKDSTLALIQNCIDDLQDQNTYQKAEDPPIVPSTTTTSKKKKV